MIPLNLISYVLCVGGGGVGGEVFGGTKAHCNGNSVYIFLFWE